MFYLVMPLILTLGLMGGVLPLFVRRKQMTPKSKKRYLMLNLGSFAAICLAMLVIPSVGVLAAEGAVAETVQKTIGDGIGLIGAALAVGLSGIGAGIAVSSSASAAIGATGEDPKVFGKAMIFVVLAEAVALYGFLIAFLILNKI